MSNKTSSIPQYSRVKFNQSARSGLYGLSIGVVAWFVTIGMSARATTITFATDPLPANNSDLPANFGSNIAGDGNGFITTDGTGATPNIALLWAPTGGTNGTGMHPDKDVLEFHSASTFAGAGFTVPVLQLDSDDSTHGTGNYPDNPTLDFLVDPGYALNLISLEIGNATDQYEAPYGWDLRLLRLSDMTEVASYSTGPMSAGDWQLATFNYTGDIGESYQLLFEFNEHGSGEGPQERTGIDNLKFSQIVVPEPTTMTLLGLCGLGLLSRRARGG